MNQNSDSLHAAQVIDTRYGKVAVPTDSEDLIVQFLEQYGEWSQLEVEFVASLLPAKSRVLDIGAYLGTFSMGLSQVADLEFVAMVEANQRVTPLLIQNAKNCLRPKSEILPALVVDGCAPAITEGWAVSGNAGSASFTERPVNAVRVQPVDARITMEELLRKWEAFHLVKMDVEGMEKQLLENASGLLLDKSILLWLECNETPGALALAQLLLETGRPLTYFAWPSHNPNNFQSTKEKIFPFAHESGLLLGAAPPPLTTEQRRVGCIIRAIEKIEDLKEALWMTPRWAPPAWDALDRFELAAVASNLLQGKTRDEFLSDAVGQPRTRNSQILEAELQRERSRAGEQIARLKQLLSEFSRRDLERLRANGREAEKVAERLREVEQSNAMTLQALQSELANCKVELEISRDATLQLTNSTTWRGAVRLSRLAGRVPLLKRFVKILLKKKQQLSNQ